MKKIILIVVVILAIAATGLYFYMYKDHRDIASEDAAYSTTVAQLQKDFSENDSISNKKYLDKTIEVYGKITNSDSAAHSIMVDEKLSARLKDSTAGGFEVGKTIKIKGRFVGYDDLLEEFQLDQATISK
jgi:putative nucleic acid binding protein